jgi:hypothetical protein
MMEQTNLYAQQCLSSKTHMRCARIKKSGWVCLNILKFEIMGHEFHSIKIIFLKLFRKIDPNC